MMWVRAIGSLPSRRLSSSGSRLASPISATMRNSAAFSAGSWLYACLSSSRAVRRDFCAARMLTTCAFGICGSESSPYSSCGL